MSSRITCTDNLHCLISCIVVAPDLTAGDTTATSISLSWTGVVSEGVSYEVNWQRDTTGECSDEDEDSATITDTSYDITGLEEDSTYSITVRASNTAGSSEDSNTITAMTLEAGERELLQAHVHILLYLYIVCIHILNVHVQNNST